MESALTTSVPTRPKLPLYKTVWFVAAVFVISVAAIGGGIGIYFKFFRTETPSSRGGKTPVPPKYLKFYNDNKAFFDGGRTNLFLADLDSKTLPLLKEFCGLSKKDREKIFVDLQPSFVEKLRTVCEGNNLEKLLDASSNISELSHSSLLVLLGDSSLKSFINPTLADKIKEHNELESLFAEYPDFPWHNLSFDSISPLDPNEVIKALDLFCKIPDKKFPASFKDEGQLRLNQICSKLQKEPNFLKDVLAPAVEAITNRDLENLSLLPFFSDIVLINLFNPNDVNSFFGQVFKISTFDQIDDVELFIKKCKIFKDCEKNSDDYAPEPLREPFEALFPYMMSDLKREELKNAIIAVKSNVFNEPFKTIYKHPQLKKFIPIESINSYEQEMQRKRESELDEARAEYGKQYDSFVNDLSTLSEEERQLKANALIDSKWRKQIEDESKANLNNVFKTEYSILLDVLKKNPTTEGIAKAENLRIANNLVNPTNSTLTTPTHTSLFVYFNGAFESKLKNVEKAFDIGEDKPLADDLKRLFDNAKSLCVDPEKSSYYSYASVEDYLKSLVDQTKIEEIKSIPIIEEKRQKAQVLYNIILVLRALGVVDVFAGQEFNEIFELELSAPQPKIISPGELVKMKECYLGILGLAKPPSALISEAEIKSLGKSYEEICSQDPDFNQKSPRVELCRSFQDQFGEKMGQLHNKAVFPDLVALFEKIKFTCDPVPEEFKSTLNDYAKSLLGKIDEIKGIADLEGKKQKAIGPFNLIQLLVYLNDEEYREYKEKNMNEIFEIVEPNVDDYTVFIENLKRSDKLSDDEINRVDAFRKKLIHLFPDDNRLDNPVKSVLCKFFSRNLTEAVVKFLNNPSRQAFESLSLEKTFNLAKTTCVVTELSLLKYGSLQDYFSAMANVDNIRNLPILTEDNKKNQDKYSKASTSFTYLDALLKLKDNRVKQYEGQTMEQIYGLVEPKIEDYNDLIKNLEMKDNLSLEDIDNAEKVRQQMIPFYPKNVLLQSSVKHVLFLFFSDKLVKALDQFLKDPSEDSSKPSSLERFFSLAKFTFDSTSSALLKHEALNYVSLQDYLFTKADIANIQGITKDNNEEKYNKAIVAFPYLIALRKLNDDRVKPYMGHTMEQVYGVAEPNVGLQQEEDPRVREEALLDKKRTDLLKLFNPLLETNLSLENMKDQHKELIRNFCSLDLEVKSLLLPVNNVFKAVNLLCDSLNNLENILNASQSIISGGKPSDYLFLESLVNIDLLEPLISKKLNDAVKGYKPVQEGPLDVSTLEFESFLTNQEMDLKSADFSDKDFFFSRNLREFALKKYYDSLENGLVNLIIQFNSSDEQKIEGNIYLSMLKANENYHANKIVYKFDPSGNSKFEDLIDCKFYSFINKLETSGDIGAEFGTYFKDPNNSPILLKDFRFMFKHAPRVENDAFFIDFATGFQKFLKEESFKDFIQSVNDYYKIVDEMKGDKDNFYNYVKLYTNYNIAMRKSPSYFSIGLSLLWLPPCISRS